VLEAAADELGKATFVANEGLAELETTGSVAAARHIQLRDAQRRMVLADLQIGLRSGRGSEVRLTFFQCVGTFLLMKGILDQAGNQERDEAWAPTFSNAQADAAANESAYFAAAAKVLAAPAERRWWRRKVSEPGWKQPPDEAVATATRELVALVTSHLPQRFYPVRQSLPSSRRASNA
jgi:hypothetical protein